MATTPDPVDGWAFEVEGLPGKLQWKARPVGDDVVVAWFDEHGFNVCDQTPYDGQTGFIVPLSVIDTLRRLQAGERAN
jgi:hypothetical protein